MAAYPQQPTGHKENTLQAAHVVSKDSHLVIRRGSAALSLLLAGLRVCINFGAAALTRCIAGAAACVRPRPPQRPRLGLSAHEFYTQLQARGVGRAATVAAQNTCFSKPSVFIRGVEMAWPLSQSSCRKRSARSPATSVIRWLAAPESRKSLQEPSTDPSSWPRSPSCPRR